MTETEHDFSEPWPMFADEDEAWKDRERLFKLLDQMDTQAEVGDALGCSPGTVSYWKNKFEEEIEAEVTDEDLECRYFSVCGNQTSNKKSGLCDLCLDLTRKADYDDLDWQTTNPDERMERLHDEYQDYVDGFEFYPKEEDDDVPSCDDCDAEMTPVPEIDAHICTECGVTA